MTFSFSGRLPLAARGGSFLSYMNGPCRGVARAHVRRRERCPMATTITVTCPECQKQIKAPPEIVGKKIRCKGCEHTFIAKADSSAIKPAGAIKPAPGGKGPPDKGAKAPPDKAGV